ncbi:cbb3-type cytochrome oxidase assembly protein CcoS [Marinobacter salexigens]|uniref:cbb3-type cytochrome oxidase assembly protein CcoS n=1 Tax=Marinobacter salexigens TaxID=1925763 RepID=UPI000C28221A|nr:cbb3-type cytochrome oxidase assembly protein CcoS [Marinobacter salexigens]
MEVVVFLIPVMLILVVMGILLFSWAVKNGQYDDLEGPAHRILYDDDKDMIPEEARTEEQKKAEDLPSEGAQDQDGSSEVKPGQP